MPQGKMKTKCQIPSGTRISQRNKKPQNPKKGARTIAPKKTKIIEATRLKRDLKKAINKSIMEEVIGTAANIETKSLQILKGKQDKKAKQDKNKEKQ